MKILTTNFLTCAVKTCKTSPASFPLHPQSCTLSRADIDFQPQFILNIIPRLNYTALSSICASLSLSALLPPQEIIDALAEKVTAGEEVDIDGDSLDADAGVATTNQVLEQLHKLLLETSIQDGKLVCGNCAFEYPVKEGVGNFLLPSHLV